LEAGPKGLEGAHTDAAIVLMENKFNENSLNSE